MLTKTDKKKPAAKKSKADSMRELREKSASAKPARALKPAKQPKHKAAKGKKPAKSGKGKKPESVALIPMIDAEDLKNLNHDADANEERLKELIPEHVVRGAEIYNVMQDHQSRELWKFGKNAGKYKSWTAFVEHYAELANISTRTLFAVVGANKMLPGVDAETKKKAGPRKVEKLKRATKVLREKTGNPEAVLPAEIIQKAVDEPVEQFEETLKSHGLTEPEPSPVVKTAPMFTDGPLVDGVPDAPTDYRQTIDAEPSHRPIVPIVDKGHDVPIDSPTGNKRVDRAIAVAIKVYDPNMTMQNALEFVADKFLKATCELVDMEDFTNDSAADEIDKRSKKKKR